MKRCSESLISRETKYLNHPLYRMAIIKKAIGNKCLVQYGEKITLEHY